MTLIYVVALLAAAVVHEFPSGVYVVFPIAVHAVYA